MGLKFVVFKYTHVNVVTFIKSAQRLLKHPESGLALVEECSTHVLVKTPHQSFSIIYLSD